MWVRRALATALLVTSGTVAFAPGASADVSVQDACPTGFFCAYDDAAATVLLLRSADTQSPRITVVSDRVSVADNMTTACWRGRNDRSFLPDTTTGVWPAFTFALATDNDNTDFFDHNCF
jgi:hypothetical protein